jgi:hypothetical protein
MTKGQVGFVGVEATVLEDVGVELRIKTDATPFLSQVQQIPTDVRDPLDRLTYLRSAVTPLAAEDVAGEALAVGAHERRSAVAVVGGEQAGSVPQPEG